MKLVIDIPEDVYTRLFDNGIQDNEIATDDICEMARSLRRGTPLPKGHGRLIDADALKKDDEVTEWRSLNAIRTGKMLKSFSELFIKKIDTTPTIIESYTESEEQERVDDYRDRLDELEREEYYESKYTNGEG